MTIKDAAAALGISRSTVYDLVRTGQLGCYRVGSRIVIEASDIEEFKRRAREEARRAVPARVKLNELAERYGL